VAHPHSKIFKPSMNGNDYFTYSPAFGGRPPSIYCGYPLKTRKREIFNPAWH
jgi:hypothetical protein